MGVKFSGDYESLRRAKELLAGSPFRNAFPMMPSPEILSAAAARTIDSLTDLALTPLGKLVRQGIILLKGAIRYDKEIRSRHGQDRTGAVFRAKSH